MQEMRAYVKGRVQMVMFRDFATRGARSLGLCGTVQNLPDGRVKVVAQGERGKLEELLARLRKGSLLSHVEGIEVEWDEVPQTFTGFTIVYKN